MKAKWEEPTGSRVLAIGVWRRDWQFHIKHPWHILITSPCTGLVQVVGVFSWCIKKLVPLLLVCLTLRHSVITRKCRTLWGRAWASSYYSYMHNNRLSFTLKWWAESLVFMSVLYARPLPELRHILQPDMYNFVRSVNSSPLMVGPWVLWQTTSKVPWVINLRCLRYGCNRCTLAMHKDAQFSGNI